MLFRGEHLFKIYLNILSYSNNRLHPTEIWLASKNSLKKAFCTSYFYFCD